MPDAREVAAVIKSWAQSNKMMGEYPISPEVNVDLIRGVFGRVGVPNAVGILQKKQISYVGVNPVSNEVIIFTEKRLAVKDVDLLSGSRLGQGHDSVNIRFEHGGSAQAGGPPAIPAGVPPYHKHGRYYACGSSVYIGSHSGAGTLGCLVRDDGGNIFGLSNNHVTGGSNYSVPGIPIVAPGMIDVSAGGEDRLRWAERTFAGCQWGNHPLRHSQPHTAIPHRGCRRRGVPLHSHLGLRPGPKQTLLPPPGPARNKGQQVDAHPRYIVTRGIEALPSRTVMHVLQMPVVMTGNTSSREVSTLDGPAL